MPYTLVIIVRKGFAREISKWFREILVSICWGIDTSLPAYQHHSLWALPLFPGV